MTQHIIDADELEVTDDIREDAIAANVITKDMDLFRQQWNCIIRYGQLRVKRALLANSPQADDVVMVPLEPTEEMINQGAQRLVSWDEGCKWPDSWTPLTIASAKNEAERVWRSMWLSAYKPQADDVRKDAERWRTFREIASEEMCYALCGNSNADNDELDQAIDKARE